VSILADGLDLVGILALLTVRHGRPGLAYIRSKLLLVNDGRSTAYAQDLELGFVK
jgi:hypothetical protein